MSKKSKLTRNQKLLLVGTIIIPILLFLFRRSNDENPNQNMKDSPGATQVMGDLNYYSPENINIRPYLSLEISRQNEYFLKRDGNSNLYFDELYNGIFLIFPIIIRNIDNINAVGIEATYTSRPTQSNVRIELGEQSSFLAAHEIMKGPLRPHVNISSVVNDDTINEFEIEFSITYESYNTKDSKKYDTTLIIELEKKRTVENNIRYQIKKVNKPLFGERK